MDDDQVDNYVTQCSSVLRSELDKNPKHNNLSVLIVNARSITVKFTKVITNLILLEIGLLLLLSRSPG